MALFANVKDKAGSKVLSYREVYSNWAKMNML